MNNRCPDCGGELVPGIAPWSPGYCKVGCIPGDKKESPSPPAEKTTWYRWAGLAVTGAYQTYGTLYDAFTSDKPGIVPTKNKKPGDCLCYVCGTVDGVWENPADPGTYTLDGKLWLEPMRLGPLATPTQRAAIERLAQMLGRTVEELIRGVLPCSGISTVARLTANQAILVTRYANTLPLKG